MGDKVNSITENIWWWNNIWKFENLKVLEWLELALILEAEKRQIMKAKIPLPPTWNLFLISHDDALSYKEKALKILEIYTSVKKENKYKTFWKKIKNKLSIS